MVKFLSALFKRPASKGSEQYDDEYVSYCIKQEQTVSELEAALHTSDNPNDIALQTLKTVCTFYNADWAGLLELDLELGVTTTGSITPSPSRSRPIKCKSLKIYIR